MLAKKGIKEIQPREFKKMGIPEKLISTMTSKDISLLLRQYRKINLIKEMRRDFLEIDSWVMVEYVFPWWQANSMSVILNDFLKAKGFKIVKAVNAGDWEMGSPRYFAVEIAPGKYVSCLEQGEIFLLHRENNSKHILRAHRTSSGNMIFSWFSAMSSTSKIIEEWAKIAMERSFYQGAKLGPSGDFLVFDRDYSWNDIILDSKIRKEVQRNVVLLLQQLEAYEKVGISTKRGLILRGPPGVGKTLLGRILCFELDCALLWITPSSIVKPGVIEGVYKFARAIAPCIVFLEDIDLYGISRESSHRPDLLGELMNSLDGIEDTRGIITIATTNDPGTLDKALSKRPGRFDRILDIPQPSQDQRIQMLETFCSPYVVELDESIWQDLATKTKEFVGARIRDLVETAALIAFEQKSLNKLGNKVILKQEHFLEALPTVREKDFSKLGFHLDREEDDLKIPQEEEEWE